MRASARIASFFVTVALALWLRNYWALVAGMLIHSVLLTGLSYAMQPYRPRLSVTRRAELLGVSLWIFLGLAAQAIYAQVERIVLGRVSSTETVGVFAVSKDLSSILTQEIATALNRVTFVQTAQAGKFTSQGARIGKALGGYAMIAAPMGLGLAAVAEDFILVVFGQKWMPATLLVPPIAIASALMAVYKLVASSLQAGGHERASALMSLIGLAALIAAVASVAARGGGALAIAQAGLGVSIVLVLGGTVLLSRLSRFPLGNFLTGITRPFLAAGVMLVMLRLLPPLSGEPLVELFWRVAVGAAAYVGLLLGLWSLTGRSDTAEGELVRLVSRVRKV